MSVGRFTDRDFATLGDATHTAPDDIASEIRSRPWSLADLLSSDDVFNAVMDRQAHPGALVSPYLLFAVLVHRSAADLREAAFVNEWAGARTRSPVFDIAGVHDFLTDPARLAFLAGLLTEFAGPKPLPVPVDDRYDLVSIAAWLDVVPDADRVVLLERLGDLALFLSGVFPDATGAAAILPVDAERLGQTIGLGSDSILSLTSSITVGGLEAYETLGASWYGAVSEERRAPIIADVAYRFRAARRVLNHVADSFLFEVGVGFGFAA